MSKISWCFLYLSIGFIIFIIIITVLMMGGSDSNVSGTHWNQEWISGEAIQNMHIVFEWNPTQATIRSKLDKVMTMYNLSISEENYNKAGSVLVVLSNGSKKWVTEMEILDYMERSYVEWVNSSFADMAAISFTALEVTK